MLSQWLHYRLQSSLCLDGDCCLRLLLGTSATSARGMVDGRCGCKGDTALCRIVGERGWLDDDVIQIRVVNEPFVSVVLGDVIIVQLVWPFVRIFQHQGR